MSDASPPKSNGAMSEDAFRALCLMYHAQEIDEAGFTALSVELDTDADRRALFVEIAMQVETVYEAFELNEAEQTAVELGIADDDEDEEDGFDLMNMVVDQALALRRQHEIEEEANRKLAAQQQEDARIRRFALRRQAKPEAVQRVVVIPQVLVWLGVAAVLGFAATVIHQVSQPASESVEQPIAEQPVVVPAPPVGPQTPQPFYVARVGDTYEAVWATRPAQGRLAQGAPATLLSGYAELVFDDGARVVLQGPAVIEPIGANAMRLASGRLTAVVSESAHGFTVHTPQMLVSNLGTAFGVVVDVAEEVTEAFVFDGLIEVSPSTTDSATAATQAISLRQGQGARGEQDRAIQTRLVNPGRFIQKVETAPYAVQTSETACFLENPPRFIRPGTLESNDWLHIFVEQTGVRPDQTFKASFTGPGTYRSFEGDGGWVDLDHAVDSYLVHLDPVGSRSSVVLEGTITFPRPVVAIIGTKGQLTDSDRLFAHPDIQLSHGQVSNSGLDGTTVPHIDPYNIDVLELSEDRRTLRYRLHAQSQTDEFRVLIEAAEVSR